MSSKEHTGNDKKEKIKKRDLGAPQQGGKTTFYGFCEKQRQASNFLGKALSNSIKMMQVDTERH